MATNRVNHNVTQPRRKAHREITTMTKKHFIALADALRAEKPGTNWDPNKMVQWELDVKAIANVCAAHNPNFNRERWLGYIAGTNGPNGGAR